MLCCSRGAMPCLDHASLITAIGHLLARQASPRAPRGPEPTEFGMAREARMPCNRLAPHAKKHFGWYRRPAPVQRPARRHPCGCAACGPGCLTWAFCWTDRDYERFNRNNINVCYWSWNYRGCWHQTCPPIVTREPVYDRPI